MAVAVVVMGVSGSGKSTIGRRLARRLACEFADADDYHPAANVAKMAAGVPLEDADRAPWLERLRDLIAERLSGGSSLVLACSALKASYRSVLEAAGSPRTPVHFVYLRADYDAIFARMRRRRGHFMKADMLASQFRDLEEPDDAVVVDADLDLGRSLRSALAGLAARGVRPFDDGAEPSTNEEENL